MQGREPEGKKTPQQREFKRKKPRQICNEKKTEVKRKNTERKGVDKGDGAKGNTVGNFRDSGVAGLEEKESLRRASCGSRNSGITLLRVFQADNGEGHVPWRCHRGSVIAAWLCDRRKNRLWGRGTGAGVRHFPGFYRKFAVVLYCTGTGGSCGTISDCNKKKRTEVSDTLYSLFAGGVSAVINMKKREWNGSFTVEASIYLPLLLFFYLFVMRAGMELYTETKETAVQIQTEEMVEVLKLFYRKEGVEDLLKDGN